jgi:hypothetical protein
MLVERFQISGHPIRVMSTIRRKISALTRHGSVRGFKIGITCNPWRRWREAYNYDYDSMYVVYWTRSGRNIDRLERDLIDHNWNVEYCHNRIGGGGGPKSSSAYYYLYVVLQGK